MKRPAVYDISNMDWAMRDYGYNVAQSRPTAGDVDRIIAERTTVRFTAAQRQSFLESADYAYSMRLRHRSQSA